MSDSIRVGVSLRLIELEGSGIGSNGESISGGCLAAILVGARSEPEDRETNGVDLIVLGLLSDFLAI